MLLPEPQITAVLRDHFGLAVRSQKPLPGEHDQNVAITTADGRRAVVKVSRAQASGSHVAWQSLILRHLEVEASNLPLPVPRLLPTAEGADQLLVGSGPGAVVVRVLTWLEGSMLCDLDRHSPELLRGLGEAAGRLVGALDGLVPPEGGAVTHHWDLLRAQSSALEGLSSVPEPARRRDVEVLLRSFERHVEPVRAALPRGVVHQDLNDFNVLAAPGPDGRHRISGVLDFSDALYTARVCELAIAVAYAMLRKDDPLAAAASVVAGFDAVLPLTDDELSVVFPLAAARLCVNATTWTHRRSTSPSPYGESRMRHTWPLIARLARVAPSFAEAKFRHAAGRDQPASTRTLTEWLHQPGAAVAPVLTDNVPVDVDLSVRSSALDGVEDLALRAPAAMASAVEGGAVRAGRHLQGRAARMSRRRSCAAPGTLHLGVDLFLPAGTTVHSPLAGRAVACDGNSDDDPPADVDRRSGVGLVLRHEAPDAQVFWTRWTGLVATVDAGDVVPAGAALGTSGVPDGGFYGAGAVTVQLLLHEDLLAADLPQHVDAGARHAWAAVSPDPSALLGIERQPDDGRWDAELVTAVRERHFAPSQRSYYREPMNLVRGDGVWLYDESARGYLDAVNNVTHVGHANRVVASAAHRQLLRLNTNSRFVYDGMARYAERLVGLLPEPLEVVFFVCTGSEANDLALRIVRQVTGREHVLIVDGAYHGNTTAVTGISPNRYKGAGGAGAPASTHEVLQPNRYRGPHGYDDPAAGEHYAVDVTRQVAAMTASGTPPAAFFAESLMGTAGTIVYPDGYLPAAFAAVRSGGGLCVSDEVQVGFGRLGTSFWGFQAQGVVPDIVTMGKPMGNGHPLAAVVTTRAIAEAFDTGMKYFNTFGGNPVSCEIGLAVLDEVERRGLQQHALETGAAFHASLSALQDRHPLIGDVRGKGLYLGVELVRDRTSKDPAREQAHRVSERLKEEGVIVYPTGTYDNVLKIKPPLLFDQTHVRLFTATLDEVLSETW